MVNIDRLIDYDELSEESVNEYFNKLLVSELTLRPNDNQPKKTTKQNCYIADEKVAILLFTRNIKIPILNNKLFLKENIIKASVMTDKKTEERFKNMLISIIINKENDRITYNHNIAKALFEITKNSSPFFNEAKKIEKIGSKTLFEMAIGETNWNKFLELRKTLAGQYD